MARVPLPSLDLIVVPPRRSLTPNQRLRLFEAHNGICVICERKIGVGEKWIDEHVNPREISADDSLDNRGPAHVDCAREKTRKDQKDIAKSRRVRKKHLGIKPSGGRQMPGGRDSGWKKTFSRGWVRRDD